MVLDMPGHGESSFDPKLNYSMFGMAKKVHLVSQIFLLQAEGCSYPCQQGVGISVVFLKQGSFNCVALNNVPPLLVP